MKTILVPTDFSSCARHAAQVALEIAAKANASVHLVHCSYLPVNTPYDQMVATVDVRLMEEDGQKAFQHFIRHDLELDPESSPVPITSEVRVGMIADEIADAANRSKASLIVMGTHGSKGLLEKLFLGSNAASVISHADVPVLIVPEKAQLNGLQQVVFATDYHELKSNDTLLPLVDLAQLFASEVHFVSVQPFGHDPAGSGQVAEEVNFDEVFVNIPHHFRVLHENDVVSAIERYARHKKADLLVTIPKKQNFIASLFHHSISRDLAYHASIPLLCLPERG